MGVYEDLGVRTLINATGTLTRIGGSIMPPEVLEAMKEAAQSYVDMDELLARAGERIARMVGVEAAFITSGAAGGLAISAAACMAGTDPVKIARLPDTTGMPNEVVMLKVHRNRYDQAIMLSGARIVEVGLCDRTLPEEMEAAFSERTAAVFYDARAEVLRASLPLRQVARMARSHGVPVIVDGAAEIPPVSNLRAYLEQGASLAVFSGGKDIRGPQSTGLILGEKKLIAACAANACPHHSVGRPMKADKESIVGLVKAVELYLQQDFEAEMEGWEATTRYFVEGLARVPGLKVWRGFPTAPGIQPVIVPRAYIEVDQARLGMTAQELSDKLLEAGIVAILSEGKLVLNPHMVRPGEEEIIVARLAAICKASLRDV